MTSDCFCVVCPPTLKHEQLRSAKWSTIDNARECTIDGVSYSLTRLPPDHVKRFVVNVSGESSEIADPPVYTLTIKSRLPPTSHSSGAEGTSGAKRVQLTNAYGATKQKKIVQEMVRTNTSLAETAMNGDKAVVGLSEPAEYSVEKSTEVIELSSWVLKGDYFASEPERVFDVEQTYTEEVIREGTSGEMKGHPASFLLAWGNKKCPAALKEKYFPESERISETYAALMKLSSVKLLLLAELESSSVISESFASALSILACLIFMYRHRAESNPSFVQTCVPSQGFIKKFREIFPYPVSDSGKPMALAKDSSVVKRLLGHVISLGIALSKGRGFKVPVTELCADLEIERASIEGALTKLKVNGPMDEFRPPILDEAAIRRSQGSNVKRRR